MDFTILIKWENVARGQDNLTTEEIEDYEVDPSLTFITDDDCYDCDPEEEFLCLADRLIWIKDKQIPFPYSNRALLTTPKGFIVKTSGIPNAGLGVWTLTDLPECVIIGPYEGEVIYQTWSTYTWELEDEEGGTRYMVDAADPAKSNWLRYVNSAMTENTTNVDSVQYNGEIYYEVNQAIPAGTELLIWYGDEYAKWMGIL